MSTIKVHSVAKLFPKMDESQFKAFLDDIKANGFQETIKYIEGDDGSAEVIDGRNRLEAAKQMKVDPWELNTKRGDKLMEKINVAKIPSLVSYVASLNLKRRHLSDSQRAAVAVAIEKEIAKDEKADERARKLEEKANPTKKEDKAEKAEKKDSKPKETTRQKAAKIMGTGDRNVGNAKMIEKKDPKLFEKVQAGEITINEAVQTIKKREASAAAEEAAESVEDIDVDDFVQILDRTEGSIKAAIKESIAANLIIANLGSLPSKEVKAEPKRLAMELSKVSAPNCAVFIFGHGNDIIGMYEPMIAAGFRLRATLTMTASPINRADNFRESTRMVLYFVTGKAVKFHPDDEILSDILDGKLTVKESVAGYTDILPGKLLGTLIGATTVPGNIVFDYNLNSAEVAAACIASKRMCFSMVDESATEKDLALPTARINSEIAKASK